MFARIKTGYELISASINLFFRRPILVLPIFICWLIYAPTVIYLEYIFPWDANGNLINLMVISGVILLFSFILSLSSLIQLELIEQIETDQPARYGAAFLLVIKRDIIRAFPIMLVWALVWFLFAILEMLFSRGQRQQKELTAENVAKTLANTGATSFTMAAIRSAQKGVRMIVFLVLPAIAWEEMAPVQAWQRGYAILKQRMLEFATGFVLTELAAGIVFFPPALLFTIVGKLKLELPMSAWAATIIYCGFAWSFMIFLEQMFSAELYLWHLSWENECRKAKLENRGIPSLAQVRRPSLLDTMPNLLQTSTVSNFVLNNESADRGVSSMNAKEVGEDRRSYIDKLRNHTR